MKTLLFFLVLTAATRAFAQTGDPGLDSLTAYHTAADRDYAERAAGMFARPLFAIVQFTDSTRHQVTVLGVKPAGLVIQGGAIPKERLGLEDRVRFGYGTPDEVAAVTKIKAEREKARIAAQQLEIQRQQAEATQAIADELRRQENNRLIFGR